MSLKLCMTALHGGSKTASLVVGDTANSPFPETGCMDIAGIGSSGKPESAVDYDGLWLKVRSRGQRTCGRP